MAGGFFNIPHSFSICRILILHLSHGMRRYVSNIYHTTLMRCDRDVSFVLSVQNKCSLFVASHFPRLVTWKVLLFPILFH